MNETKAAFAERTILSRKIIRYRYMEVYGYNYIHKLSQFVTTLKSRKNCSINLKLDSKTLLENRTPKLKTGNKFVSRGMIHPSGRVRSFNLQRKFLKLFQFLPENLQRTQ